MQKLLIIALFLIFSVQVLAKQKTESQLWDETEMSVKNVTFFVNQTNCYSKEVYLFGCFEALNVLAQFARPESKEEQKNEIKFIPASYKMQYPQKVVKTLSEYNGLLLVELSQPENSDKLSAVQAYQIVKAENEAYHKSIATLQNGPKLKFEKIAEALVSKQTKKENTKLSLAASINAYLHYAYDPHTSILATADLSSLSQDKPLFGIAVSISKAQNGLAVEEVFTGGPAEKSGIKENDVITHVDGVPVADLPINDGVDKIRGEEGTQVRLKLVRDGKTIDVTVTRQRFVPENVTSKIVDDFGTSYIYVKMRQFTRYACAKVRAAILSKTQIYKTGGIILDLRSNPGGLLHESMCLGAFLSANKPVVYVKNLDTNEEENIEQFKSDIWLTPDTKVAVLINGGSASASEVVAGALQDHKAAWIVGERSFGKGTVQHVITEDPRSEDYALAKIEFGLPKGVSVKKTVQRFYSPNKISNQIVGVVPDIIAPIKPDATEDDLYAFREENLFSSTVSGASKPRPLLRQEEVKTLNSKCLNKNKSEALYKEKMSVKQKVDYQLLKAQEILNCDYEVFGSESTARKYLQQYLFQLP
ncbi:MAG: PDZ domain-containing protein [Oligoflexia bacterium]|nr:PDZ domain-containing protein [Oligoflexia bacterium]